jgi:hypothetical protein
MQTRIRALDGTETVIPGAPAPVPDECSLIELLAALTDLQWITEDDALAAAQTGALPASLATALLRDADAKTAFRIRLTWAGMYLAERAHPFWDFVKAAGIATDADIDAVFRRAKGQA